jgi:hypothetical protein
MCKIPYVTRVGARYVFRRRVHFRNIISKPVMVALRTAEPKVARTRAAFMSARFAHAKSRVEAMLEDNKPLTGQEIEAIFRQELEQELTRNVHDAFENAPYSDSVAECAVALAEAYRIARRPNRPKELTDADRADLEARGLGNDIRQIEEYLAEHCQHISDKMVIERLHAIGRLNTEGLLETARSHMLRAHAEGWLRTTRVFDEDILNASSPLNALLMDPVGRNAVAAPEPALPQADTRQDCLFQIHEKRRFSQIIDEIIDDLKQDGVWKGDTKQQRRIMETFAWITDDLPLGDYNHTHVAAFKKGLQKLPAKFYFGSLGHGTMARSFSEVVAALPQIEPSAKRNPKTINRDLSTMATVAKQLESTAWKPKVPGAVIMNFGAVRIPIKDDEDIDLRPPWTTAHIHCLFESPIYTGGGGALHRLKQLPSGGAVWHDAAYFAPLIWYYTHACREEILGLEVDEVQVSGPVPFLYIKDNATRGRDGELAGEKRRARRRKLPIHPELVRLGLLDYVAAIRAEGHTALFPELYLLTEKRGGAQFYERAWQHMVTFIGDRMAIPKNPRGKGPDIHSIRSLGSSFYEVDGVNPILRADVMGHAREGTNAKHYSKRSATEGEEVVLQERLAFMTRYIPVISAEILPRPIRLLPIGQRSRVGSPHARKTRSDKRPRG